MERKVFQRSPKKLNRVEKKKFSKPVDQHFEKHYKEQMLRHISAHGQNFQDPNARFEFQNMAPQLKHS